jgi:hypothetical protein
MSWIVLFCLQLEVSIEISQGFATSNFLVYRKKSVAKFDYGFHTSNQVYQRLALSFSRLLSFLSPCIMFFERGLVLLGGFLSS